MNNVNKLQIVQDLLLLCLNYLFGGKEAIEVKPTSTSTALLSGLKLWGRNSVQIPPQVYYFWRIQNM
jgi:hypothetical protein